MSTTLTRPGSRLRRTLAGAVTTALAASSIALLPSGAQAAPTGTVTAGTATWGLSTYLGSDAEGGPNPLAGGYIAPATFSADTKLSTWGAVAGAIENDGAASLAFEGTSVNFAKTSGAWLKFADLEVDLDANGNGAVSAEVTYGLSTEGTPGNRTYNPAQPPRRGPERIDVLALSGNTAASRTFTATSASWNGLKSAFTTEFTSFVAGDDTAVPAILKFSYNAQIGAALPISFSVTRATAAITSATITEQTPSSLKVALTGNGYREGSPGIYISIGETGNSNVTDRNQFLGTVWGSLDRGGNSGAAVQPDGSSQQRFR